MVFHFEKGLKEEEHNAWFKCLNEFIGCALDFRHELIMNYFKTSLGMN